MQRIIISAAVTIFGAAITLVSANLSWHGYAAAFENIPFVGAVGAAIAGLAFVTVYAIPVCQRQGNWQGVGLGVVMMLILTGADITGNNYALGGEVKAAKEAFQADTAAYMEAEASLVEARKRLTTATDELAIAAGSDILAAQRLLMLKGKYEGKLDGVAGPVTQAGMIQLAGELRRTIETEKTTEANAAAIVAAGKPVDVGSSESLKALGISAALSILALMASYLASSILTGGRGLEDELSGLEDGVGELEAEIFDLVTWVADRKAAA